MTEVWIDKSSSTAAGVAIHDLDESQDPLEESRCTGTDDSEDEVVEDSVLEEIQEFESTFKGIAPRYRLINRIGDGTFSTVYKAEDLQYDLYRNEWDIETKESNRWWSPSTKRSHSKRSQTHFVAIKKIYVTSSPYRILNELELLHDLKDCPAVCPLITAFRHQDQVIAILPYFQHRDFREYFRSFTVDDMRHYFFSLFTALASVHDHGILHRDIKPTNFLYYPNHARGVLVDFGLAEREGSDWLQCICSSDDDERRSRIKHSHWGRTQSQRTEDYVPSVLKNDSRSSRRANRAGTRGFRAPEVLLKCMQQTTSIDIWSVGVILLIFLSRRFPFFHAADDIDALIELATIFGRRRMREVALLHGEVFETNIPTITDNGHGFQKIILWCQGRQEKDNSGKVIDALSPEEVQAVDFMKACLELDPRKRMTAEQALEHPFITNRGSEADDGEDAMDLLSDA